MAKLVVTKISRMPSLTGYSLEIFRDIHFGVLYPPARKRKKNGYKFANIFLSYVVLYFAAVDPAPMKKTIMRIQMSSVVRLVPADFPYPEYASITTSNSFVACKGACFLRNLDLRHGQN